MKKTLLSVLAAVSVIGSASAVPSPADRKALCEKHPDKYVWVEKTEACVPINPCLSDNIDIKIAYCLHAFPMLPSNSEKRDLIINRYVEKVLKTQVSEIQEFSTSPDVGVKTIDGGYFAALSGVTSHEEDESVKCHLSVHRAFAAYGYYGKDLFMKDYDNGKIGISYKFPSDSSECEDIADFASLLADQIVYKDPYEENCTLMCPDL